MLFDCFEGVNIRKKCTLRQIFFLVVQMMETYFVTAGFVKRVDTFYANVTLFTDSVQTCCSIQT